MIEVQNIVYSYPNNEFQLNVPRLKIRQNEKIALVGPSGVGKTTLLNLIAGILTPSSGKIMMDGLAISDLGFADRQDFRIIKMGLIFQEFGLLEYLTVLENICLPFRINPMLNLTEEVLNWAHELAEKTGLTDKLHRYPKNLSQGERQRIEVCRALITKPAFIIGDEPTGNLDPVTRDKVSQLLFEYSETNKAPIFVVTHDYELANEFDKIINIQELLV